MDARRFFFYVAVVLAAYLVGTVAFLAVVYTRLALDPRRSPRARPLRAAVREIGWALLTEWTVPFAWLFWPPWWTRPGRSVGAGLPVLLVHGWGQNRADFWGLAWRLRRRTGRALFGVNYWFFGPVDRSARRLERAVARVRERTGAPRVHLVCHSLGGVVARHFVETRGGAEVVASVTTLGSPHAGTVRARPHIGEATRQLTPGSAFLAALGPPTPPAGVRYHAVWSHTDGMILPADSGSLQSTAAGPELVLEDVGHLSLLYHRRAAEQVVTWLADAERDTAGEPAPARLSKPGSCALSDEADPTSPGVGTTPS